MKLLAVLIIFGTLLATFGCILLPEPPMRVPAANDSGATSQGVNSVVLANNQFAIDLYSNLSGNTASESNNLFFSPYSITSAMAILYEGARGNTSAQMQSVLHLPTNDATRRSSFASIYNTINNGDASYQLYSANALWVEKTYPLLPSYIDLAHQYYGANATNLDIVGDPENSRATINNWVLSGTNNKIPSILPPGSLNPLTRLVITNAIYFKGTWVTQFDKQLTRDGEFRVAPGKNVTAQMMHIGGEGATFNYTYNSELQAIEMPYEGGRLSMLVLLPTSDNLSSLENSLDAKKIAVLRASFEPTKIDVVFPKFSFKSTYSLGKTLEAMGMKDAFDSNSADFSGIDGSKNLSIQEVYHKAFVDVNEEGTEAGAATAITIGAGAARPNIFLADHPFIFIIQESGTGNILFIGRVMDPTG